MTPSNNYVEIDNAIIEEVDEAIKQLSAGTLCTMHNLLSKALLDCLAGLHRLVGQRLSYLVSIGAFPLERSGFDKSRHNQYKVVFHKTTN